MKAWPGQGDDTGKGKELVPIEGKGNIVINGNGSIEETEKMLNG